MDKELLSAWLSYLVQSSRSAPLINKENSLLHTLEMTMAKYLKDVRRHTYRADKRYVIISPISTALLTVIRILYVT